MSNPYANASRQEQSVRDDRKLQIGYVNTVPQQGSNGLYHAEIDGNLVTLQPTAHGDLYIPPQGSQVLYYETREDEYVTLQSAYTDTNSPPSIYPGERVLSHPLSDSRVYFQRDGTCTVRGDGGNTVTLKPNGDVVINGGQTRAMTDVSASTTTDGDGHVTDVSLNITRSDSVYLP